MARPEGDSHGASGQVFSTFNFLVIVHTLRVHSAPDAIRCSFDVRISSRGCSWGPAIADDHGRVTGNPEVIDSSVELVPLNAQTEHFSSQDGICPAPDKSGTGSKGSSEPNLFRSICNEPLKESHLKSWRSSQLLSRPRTEVVLHN